MKNWRTQVYMIGIAAGVLTGLAAAYIIIQRSETLDNKPKISSGDAVKVGLGVLGLLRLVSDFADRQ